MRVYSVYMVDTEKYSCRKLFDMEAASPLDLLTVARMQLDREGIQVTPPLCLDVRPIERPPLNMFARYEKIHGASLSLSDAPAAPMFAAGPGADKWLN